MNKKSIGSGNKHYILYLFFIFGMAGFYLSDGVNKYMRFSGQPEIAVYFRAIYEVILVFALFITLNKRSLSILQFLVLLVLVVLLGVGFNQTDVNYQYNFIILNKYVFIFLLTAVFYKLLEIEQYVDRICKIFEIIIIFNSLLIIVGAVFQVGMLETYAFNNQDYLEPRYGYSGLIYSQNEVTYIYILSVVYFYKKYQVSSYTLKFFLVLLSAILLGTKGIYLFLLIFFLYYLKSSGRAFLLGLSTFFSGLLLAISNFGYLSSLFKYFFVQSESDDLIYVLSSGRNYLVMKNFLNNIKASYVFLLFGGQDSSHNLVELELFDLINFFGIVGSLIYLYCYYKFVLRGVGEGYYEKMFLISLIIVAFFSGHLLSNINISFFMLCVLSYFHVKSENKIT